MAVSLASCGEPQVTISALPFEEVFELTEVIELGEDPIDSIAEIGVFVERRDGGFIIGDRLLPRVRTYSQDGLLEAAFGRYGDGPWEFRGIGSLTETASGRIVVASMPNAWLTYLHADLTPDTLLAFDGHWVGQMLSYATDIVFLGLGRGSGNSVADTLGGHVHRLVGGRVAWSSWTSPYTGKPYWSSFGDVSMAVAGDSVFVMPALLYPATVLNGEGDSVGTIGTPPPSFRRIPEIPRGYFAFGPGEAPSAERMREVLSSYDLVPRIDAVGADHLVFTIARPDHTSLSPQVEHFHTSVEVYDRQTGTKLFEDVALPDGVKVLGGGRYLYVLQNPDIPPWRIAKYRLRVAD